jgi:hypothetical protein
MAETNKEKLRKTWPKFINWTHRRVPTGGRTVIGILLTIGGVLGFLPVLGFWMIPLGVAVIALDFKVISRRYKRRKRKHHE